MAAISKSRVRDTSSSESSIRDIHGALVDLLKEARLERRLSQQELARKLGMRQRQISDLERAAMDPRLSTIQNVARALDLELMLVPRSLITAVEGLRRAGAEPGKRPLYALDPRADEAGAADDADSVGDEPRVEVGGFRPSEDVTPSSRRRTRGPE